MSEWFYEQRGEKKGPVSSSTLKKLAADRTLAPSDMVWRDGLPSWVQAARVKGLCPAVDGSTQAAMPPPLPRRADPDRPTVKEIAAPSVVRPSTPTPADAAAVRDTTPKSQLVTAAAVVSFVWAGLMILVAMVQVSGDSAGLGLWNLLVSGLYIAVGVQGQAGPLEGSGPGRGRQSGAGSASVSDTGQ